MKKHFEFSDFIEPLPNDDSVPYLDRAEVYMPALSEPHKKWREDGVMILPNFLPDNLIERYCSLREKLDNPNGWNTPIPYMHHEEIRDIALYPPLMLVLKDLIGDDMGLHLNLTGWVSTERNWHQDGYLNPEFVGSWYVAVWMALDDIHPDSGPFEFVPGSHRWGMMTRSKIWEKLTEEERERPDWPKLSEKLLNKPCEKEIKARGAKVYQFLAKKGDVLIWHSRLLHRGSEPKKPGMQRKALINHYSGLTARKDMPVRKQHTLGCYYFVLHTNDPIEGNFKK